MNLNTFNYKKNNFTIYIVNYKKKIFYNQNYNSLLLILKFNKIYIEYQCCSGYCGTCRIQLLQGEICYLQQKPIASMHNKNDIFPCFCQPKGNIIISI
ncbi:class I ribonucleotide reductase maintenance protein YfaE [Buchnera aphidicola]|uniref:class I ribonucleotide reductase maintenance protein YfaE n=1 Tax=Buchnera aphidicola TaxID=9 RepID=UPI003464B6F9